VNFVGNSHNVSNLYPFLHLIFFFYKAIWYLRLITEKEVQIELAVNHRDFIDTTGNGI
jgi:hypothetical protein